MIQVATIKYSRYICCFIDLYFKINGIVKFDTLYILCVYIKFTYEYCSVTTGLCQINTHTIDYRVLWDGILKV